SALYACKAAAMSAAFFGAFQPMHLQITRGGWRLPSKTSHSPLSSPFASKNRRCSMLAGVPCVACVVRCELLTERSKNVRHLSRYLFIQRNPELLSAYHHQDHVSRQL